MEHSEKKTLKPHRRISESRGAGLEEFRNREWIRIVKPLTAGLAAEATKKGVRFSGTWLKEQTDANNLYQHPPGQAS